MCKQDCCCKGCCHGSACNKACRVLSLIICILAFFIHCAAAGHTEWMCADLSWLRRSYWLGSCALAKRSLFHEITLLVHFKDYSGGADGGYLGACAAFAILALLSSFMAIIFICIRMCKIHKIVEIFTLLFIFGAVGAEFLTWVIYVAVRAGDKGWKFGQGLNCSIASMVLSFIVFVLTAVSVKMSACKPIVSKGGNDQQVVVVQAQPGMVIVGGGQPQQQQYAQPQGQAPPAYAEPQKQPVY